MNIFCYQDLFRRRYDAIIYLTSPKLQQLLYTYISALLSGDDVPIIEKKLF